MSINKRKESPPKMVATKKAKPAAPKKVKKKKKVKYLNKADMLIEIIKSKEIGQMSDKLARMLTMLADNYGKKSNFANYSYNDDMKAYAMMMLVRTWHKFDETRFDNPFAFYTQCVKSSFIQFLNQEKRQRLIRDEILVKKGLTPSFNYQLDYEENHGKMQSEDFYKHNKNQQNPTESDAVLDKKTEEDFLKF